MTLRPHDPTNADPAAVLISAAGGDLVRLVAEPVGERGTIRIELDLDTLGDIAHYEDGRWRARTELDRSDAWQAGWALMLFALGQPERLEDVVALHRASDLPGVDEREPAEIAAAADAAASSLARCTLYSPGDDARCTLFAGHEGEHRMGAWS